MTLFQTSLEVVGPYSDRGWNILNLGRSASPCLGASTQPHWPFHDHLRSVLSIRFESPNNLLQLRTPVSRYSDWVAEQQPLDMDDFSEGRLARSIKIGRQTCYLYFAEHTASSLAIPEAVVVHIRLIVREGKYHIFLTGY